MLTSSYQAEYGRSSGLQVTAVTKSGTNRFRGSLYDVERNSDWNANSKTNILNGDPKTTSKQRDWGYSIGGPVGKPGGSNKLFFFYAQEFQPRSTGNNVVRFRMPTRARAGRRLLADHRQQRQPVSLHQGSRGDRRVHARRAQARVLRGRRRARPDPGRSSLSDRPEHPQAVPAAEPHEHARAGSPTTSSSRGPTQSITSWQPAVRIDYQPMPGLARVVQVRGVGTAEGRRSSDRSPGSTTRR